MENLIDESVKAVFLVFTPIVAGFAVAVLVRLFQKFGLQVSAEHQARVEAIVRNAIFFAEEKVAAAVKRHATHVQGKLRIATQEVLNKVPGISELEAEALITQELPKLGLGATDFTRSVVSAATNDAK